MLLKSQIGTLVFSVLLACHIQHDNWHNKTQRGAPFTHHWHWARAKSFCLEIWVWMCRAERLWKNINWNLAKVCKLFLGDLYNILNNYKMNSFGIYSQLCQVPAYRIGSFFLGKAWSSHWQISILIEVIDISVYISLQGLIFVPDNLKLWW